MIIPDLNLLLHAINKDSPLHEKAHRWLENLMNGEEQVGMAWSVVLGFLRISTRPGLLPRPLRLDRAFRIADEWFAQSIVVPLRPGAGHWGILKGLLTPLGTGGNLVTDAHLAALAIEHDGTIHSADNDFKRFRGLRFHNPLGS